MKFLSTIFILGLLNGCGVRGDPMPPATPAELGRGKPNYRRATEELAFPATNPPTPEPEVEESEDEF